MSNKQSKMIILISVYWYIFAIQFATDICPKYTLIKSWKLLWRLLLYRMYQICNTMCSVSVRIFGFIPLWLAGLYNCGYIADSVWVVLLWLEHCSFQQIIFHILSDFWCFDDKALKRIGLLNWKQSIEVKSKTLNTLSNFKFWANCEVLICVCSFGSNHMCMAVSWQKNDFHTTGPLCGKSTSRWQVLLKSHWCIDYIHSLFLIWTSGWGNYPFQLLWYWCDNMVMSLYVMCKS